MSGFAAQRRRRQLQEPLHLSTLLRFPVHAFLDWSRYGKRGANSGQADLAPARSSYSESGHSSTPFGQATVWVSGSILTFRYSRGSCHLSKTPFPTSPLRSTSPSVTEKLVLMAARPLCNQSPHARAQFSFEHRDAPDFHQRLLSSIPCVEVWRSMLAVIHVDRDSEELRNLRHPPFPPEAPSPTGRSGDSAPE